MLQLQALVCKLHQTCMQKDDIVLLLSHAMQLNMFLHMSTITIIVT